jgi:dienelactone hydrolase
MIAQKRLSTSAEVTIDVGEEQIRLPGTLSLTSGTRALVIFAHGSGSSRKSPRNVAVAQTLQAAGIGTLLFDLLTPAEDRTYETRFDIDLLSARLGKATSWAQSQPSLSGLALGYFGASTGAAAALIAAAEGSTDIGAVVSRGGRPDLAAPDVLARVRAPTLLIVGGEDHTVLDLNRDAYGYLGCEKALRIVPGATHLFEEPGALESVAVLAAAWFGRWLSGAR